MCEVCKNLTIGIYPTPDIRMKVLGSDLLLFKEKLFRTKYVSIPINYCPQCRKEVVVCHI